jgi:hypothetical protein
MTALAAFVALVAVVEDQQQPVVEGLLERLGDQGGGRQAAVLRLRVVLGSTDVRRAASRVASVRLPNPAPATRTVSRRSVPAASRASSSGRSSVPLGSRGGTRLRGTPEPARSRPGGRLGLQASFVHGVLAGWRHEW